MPDSNANIARHLSLMAASQPERAALKVPRGRRRSGEIDYLTLSFAELDAEVAAWSARLQSAGVQRGDRTLVMVKQGLPLIASVFALFEIGAVPVVIDPGMGRKNFLACVVRSQPRAMIGIPLARVLSHVFRRAFRSIDVRVGASGRLTARLTPPGARRDAAAKNTSLAAISAASDLAAVLFTSGSTGAPKGVCYEHGMFDAQVRAIRATYRIEPGEIDLPLLPIFALFNPALGMTTIVPEIDPRKPAAMDPAKIVQAIRQEGVTNSFGSPTLWGKIAAHCVKTGTTLPGMKRVLCAGAPVPLSLWESSVRLLPHGELHSPYGATEALPITSISSSTLPLAEVRNMAAQGACVGRPVEGVAVKIIAVRDGAIATLAGAQELPPGSVGEIIVRGPMVTTCYDRAHEATTGAKIRDGDAVWHRMGDCGALDAEGRLWFHGRKVERVQTSERVLFTEPCERVFRQHPRVRRCALIGIGPREKQRAALVVEAHVKSSSEARAFARELRALGKAAPDTAAIKVFYFNPRFPVDVRHNAKIHRLTLARWAATAKGFEIDPKR